MFKTKLLYPLCYFFEFGYCLETRRLFISNTTRNAQAFRELKCQRTLLPYFGNPVRNRANDDGLCHQDPDYYLTGYKEPNCVLVLFSSDQTAKDGKI
jgi:hypothetical protein